MTTHISFNTCVCGNKTFRILEDETTEGLFLSVKLISICTYCGVETILKEVTEEIH